MLAYLVLFQNICLVTLNQLKIGKNDNEFGYVTI